MAEFAIGNGARADGQELKKRFRRFYAAQANGREEIQSPQLSSSFPFGRVRQVPDRALVNRAAQRLGRAASIPRAE
jgi:hypothetical protein